MKHKHFLCPYTLEVLINHLMQLSDQALSTGTTTFSFCCQTFSFGKQAQPYLSQKALVFLIERGLVQCTAAGQGDVHNYKLCYTQLSFQNGSIWGVDFLSTSFGREYLSNLNSLSTFSRQLEAFQAGW